MTAKKTIPIKQLTSWSFSRYSDYRQCPLKAKLKHIDKISEPPNAAMARGAQIHALAEDYIKGKVAKLAPELALFKAEFDALRKLFKKSPETMVVEDNWAFTKDWDETAWNNWTACWVRIKLDCAHHLDDETLCVTDWKTGKFRQEQNEEYVEQLELYALSALLLHDHIQEVRPRLGYTDQGFFYPEPGKELVYRRSDVAKLAKTWEGRVRPMMNDKTFAPRPNNKCQWCFYGQSGKAKGGPGLCKY